MVLATTAESPPDAEGRVLRRICIVLVGLLQWRLGIFALGKIAPLKGDCVSNYNLQKAPSTEGGNGPASPSSDTSIIEKAPPAPAVDEKQKATMMNLSTRQACPGTLQQHLDEEFPKTPDARISDTQSTKQSLLINGTDDGKYVGMKARKEHGLKASLKSQSQEDRILWDRWFSKSGRGCHGTYLELGALDGVRFSNTFFFNKVPKMGWKGVLIEADPKSFSLLKKNRPADQELALINAAVCKENRELHYISMGPVGGIWEFAAQSFKDQWWTNLTDKIVQETGKKISCSPLPDLLDQHLPLTAADQTNQITSAAPATTTPRCHYFDFWSLDVEGAELVVLEAIDWTRLRFGVIVVECDNHDLAKNQRVIDLLLQQGYRYVTGPTVEKRNCWFENAEEWSLLYAQPSL